MVAALTTEQCVTSPPPHTHTKKQGVCECVLFFSHRLDYHSSPHKSASHQRTRTHWVPIYNAYIAVNGRRFLAHPERSGVAQLKLNAHGGMNNGTREMYTPLTSPTGATRPTRSHLVSHADAGKRVIRRDGVLQKLGNRLAVVFP